MIAMQEQQELQLLQCIKRAMDRVLHRIQNELSGSQTLITLMDKKVLDEDSEKEAMSRISSSYRKLLDICSSYENLSLRCEEPLVLRPICISHLVSIILKEDAALIEERRVKVTVDISDDFICDIDDSKLYLVFGQLIKNSLLHTKTGASLHIWLETSTPFYKFNFKDNGPGIPTELNKELFKDVLVKKLESGEIHLCFGLLSCALLVRLHGGEIAVQSSTADGTHVEVSVPISKGVKHV